MLMRYRLTHRKLFRNLFFLLGSIASISALLENFIQDLTTIPEWAFFLFVLAALLFILLVWFEISERPQRRIYSKGDTEGILLYMHDWIQDGGRVAIWTRDMSWADDERTENLLRDKAAKDELVIFSPSSSPLTQSLADAGAEVYYYGKDRLDSPSSRFTITQFGRHGSSVAVGRAGNRTHIIDEFHSGDHPAFHIAADLVTLAKSLKRSEKNLQ